MKTIDLVMQNKERIREIVEANKCYDPKLFGSVARGEDTEESDIDIQVSLTDKASLWSLGAILWRLEELLGRKVDLVNSKTIKEQFRPFIEKDLIDI